jgi:hypothetical protein
MGLSRDKRPKLPIERHRNHKNDSGGRPNRSPVPCQPIREVAHRQTNIRYLLVDRKILVFLPTTKLADDDFFIADSSV